MDKIVYYVGKKYKGVKNSPLLIEGSGWGGHLKFNTIDEAYDYVKTFSTKGIFGEICNWFICVINMEHKTNRDVFKPILKVV